MSERITIAGQVFTAPTKYSEGHELNANEAAALNQTYHENLRNNFAKRVKDAVEKGTFDEAAMQAEFDTYANDYEFGVRTGGGGGAPRDPVQAEALNIARAKIRDALKKAGKKNVDPKAINEAAVHLVEKNPAIIELAKKRVEEQRAIASADLGDLVSGLPEKAPETAQAAE